MTTNHMVVRCRYDAETGADRYDNILYFTDDIDISDSIDKSLLEPEDILYVCDIAYASSLLEYSDDIFAVDENRNILFFPGNESMNYWIQEDRLAESLIIAACDAGVDRNLITLACCDMCRWYVNHAVRYRDNKNAAKLIDDVEANALGKRNDMDLAGWSMYTNSEEYGWSELNSLVNFAIGETNNASIIARNLDAEAHGFSLGPNGQGTSRKLAELVRERIPTRKFILALSKKHDRFGRMFARAY